MSKHRRKSYRRQITVAAVVVAAVGAPTAAMACLDWRDGGSGQDRSHARSASDGHRASGSAADARHAAEPGARPSGKPTAKPTGKPTARPTAKPTGKPTARPTAKPTAKPTARPTAEPTARPTVQPTVRPTASTPAPSGPSSATTARVVELVNSERAKVGCAPVKVNDLLTKAAQGHSKDMADHSNMSHTGSDGSSPGDRITRAGYTWRTYGENVAYGYATPEQVMAGWMSSDGHKRNILNCGFKEIGVGLAQPGNYWTQVFGASAG
ncbi:CAP domain-containing protein [Streptomyces sp. NPDC018031]|uniref:CAP domain-containing protein n=1 Tax=Streptomyces sp. NPDC018031 TaxID=3365033 RepID=UPI00379BF2F6